MLSLVSAILAVVIKIPKVAMVPMLVGTVALLVLLFAGAKLKDWKDSQPGAATKTGMVVAAALSAYALYVAAPFVDETPMVNVHDPHIEPDRGWAGDCLQVRLCSDPAEKYPLMADTVARQGSDRICHLTMWYFTPRNEPVLDIRYSMAYHGAKLLTGTKSGLAFRKSAGARGRVKQQLERNRGARHDKCYSPLYEPCSHPGSRALQV